MSFKKNKHIIFLINIIVLSVWTLFIPTEKTILLNNISCIVSLITGTGLFYLFYSLLIPEILFKKKIARFVLCLIFILIFYSISRGLIVHFFSFLIAQTNFSFAFYDFGQNLLWGLLYTVLGCIFRIIESWIENQKIKSELENKNIQNELAMLRSQINPHFLFNTLNNIHSYAYVNPDITANALEKLSDIMRYMLCESDTDKVLLEREIDYLQSYIVLLNLKFKNQDYVQFSIQGNYSGLMISPLLLVPFLENAFKHGKKRNSSPGIKLNLKIEQKKIIFEIENYIAIKDNTEIKQQGGIGLQNIRRRLELLYPQKHQLEIIENEELFKVKLILLEK